MDERCNDCKPAIECEQLKAEVDSLKAQFADLKTEVSNVKTSQAVNQEQTKMVFKILNEIKESIKIISDKLDILEKAPGKKWDDLIKVVITVVATAAVTYFISH